MTAFTHPEAAHAARQQPAPTGAADFFAAAHQAYEAAAATAGVSEATFLIGGQHIRMCFAGRAWLPQFIAALQHRAAPPVAVSDLTVCVWDDASTGAHIPPPPWSTADYSPRGEIAAYSSARHRAAYQIDAGVLSLLDTQAGLGLLWTADAARLPRYELTFPARALLYWWADVRGLQMAHAGAVGQAAGGVLLVGKGGSGKSTTALACLEDGLDYAGDDYVLFDDQPAPRAHSVYSTGKLHADHIGRLPAYVPLISNREQLGPEKALLYLAGHQPERLVADLPLSAIVLPRVTRAARTSFRPVSTVETLGALAPSSLRQLPGASEADYQRMSRLARRLPGYVLELGADIEEIPMVVRQLIAEASRT